MTTPAPASTPASPQTAVPQDAGDGVLARLRRFEVGGLAKATGPILLAFLVGAAVLAATGKNPFSVYRLLATEAFGDGDRFATTLTSATPLMFVGLATALAYRAGVFTIGVEGSFVSGGLAAAVVGAHVGGLPSVLAILAALGAAVVVGVLVAVIPAFLRAYFQVDEVVTTLMFNFIASGVTGWLVQSSLQAKGVANSATEFVAPSAELPRLMPPNQLNVGLLIALALLVGYALWIRRSSLGYEFRQVGQSPRFSVAHGINVRRVILVAMLAAGAVGGLGGGAHALGVVHRFVGGFSAGFGFTGIAIALLARFSATGVVLCSILFGALASAGSTIQLFSDVPLDIVDVLQGAVMVFAVAQFALPKLRGRRRRA